MFCRVAQQCCIYLSLVLLYILSVLLICSTGRSLSKFATEFTLLSSKLGQEILCHFAVGIVLNKWSSFEYSILLKQTQRMILY